jgi:hypothetical protein
MAVLPELAGLAPNWRAVLVTGATSAVSLPFFFSAYLQAEGA